MPQHAVACRFEVAPQARQRRAPRERFARRVRALQIGCDARRVGVERVEQAQKAQLLVVGGAGDHRAHGAHVLARRQISGVQTAERVDRALERGRPSRHTFSITRSGADLMRLWSPLSLARPQSWSSWSS